MKKVFVDFVEHHIYSVEVEIPDNLSPEEELDWVMENRDILFESKWPDPIEIETDWDSLNVYEVS